MKVRCYRLLLALSAAPILLAVRPHRSSEPTETGKTTASATDEAEQLDTFTENDLVLSDIEKKAMKKLSSKCIAGEKKLRVSVKQAEALFLKVHHDHARGKVKCEEDCAEKEAEEAARAACINVCTDPIMKQVALDAREKTIEACNPGTGQGMSGSTEDRRCSIVTDFKGDGKDTDEEDMCVPGDCKEEEYRAFLGDVQCPEGSSKCEISMQCNSQVSGKNIGVTTEEENRQTIMLCGGAFGAGLLLVGGIIIACAGTMDGKKKEAEGPADGGAPQSPAADGGAPFSPAADGGADFSPAPEGPGHGAEAYGAGAEAPPAETNAAFADTTAEG